MATSAAMMRADRVGPARRPSRLAWSCVAAALALAVANQIVAFSDDERSLGDILLYDLSWAVISVVFALLGALIAARQTANPTGWILCGLPVLAGLGGLSVAYFDDRSAEISDWLESWLWIPFVLVPLVFLPLYFPYGRLPSGRWRLVPWVGGAGILAMWVSEALDVEAAGVGFIAVLGAVAASAASLVVRFRRSVGDERRRIGWLARGAGVAAGAFLLSVPLSLIVNEDVANAVVLAGILVLPLAVAVAILRHGLYDVDVLVNRTLVYGGLTLSVVVSYVAAVGGLSAVFHERAGAWVAVLGTGLAALLVQPVRGTLQRRVDRVMYGGADHARDPERGLRDRAREVFAPEAAELQRARERLVAAREEDRRRLRRDLHDELGPALAGAGLKLAAAENLLASDAAAAAGLVAGAREEIQEAVADVRRLVYELRPPALDELGLVGALREQAQRLRTDSLVVDVDGVGELDGLPAAVEVAAYRIALEAMTNAARHAGADHCSVRLELGPALVVEVTDDGVGIPGARRAGVGIGSMTERAEELGGRLTIERADPAGTRVRAELPVRRA